MPKPPRTLRFNTMPGLVRAFRRWAEQSSVSVEPVVDGANPGERQVLGALGGCAAAVAGDHVKRWPKALQLWAKSAEVPPQQVVERVREELGTRSDPLTSLYNASISAAHRRRLGTVFTPAPLVDHMLDLADNALTEPPACVLDPGAGVGAFTIAAAR